jgi:multisubunit Na+/H+ antiporter MnhC subunit
MPLDMAQLFWMSGIFVILLFIIGLYCVLATFNLIRALIGVELLIKAVTLLIVVAGYVSGRQALAQSLIITLIVIEVVVMTVAAGVVIGVYQHHKDLDVRKLRNLKG